MEESLKFKQVLGYYLNGPLPAVVFELEGGLFGYVEFEDRNLEEIPVFVRNYKLAFLRGKELTENKEQYEEAVKEILKKPNLSIRKRLLPEPVPPELL